MSIVHEPNYKDKRVTLLKDARVDAISLVDVGANNQEFFLLKRATNFIDEYGSLHHSDTSVNNVDKVLPLIKGGGVQDEWKVAYAIVAVPGEIDQQKDVWDEQGIRRSAHDFLKNGPLINYMHEDMRKVGEVVESAIALTDLDINGRIIKKGSWYIGIEPHDSVKQMIKSGQITGVSVQGTSKRQDIPQESLEVEVDTEGRRFVKSYITKGGFPVNSYQEHPFREGVRPESPEDRRLVPTMPRAAHEDLDDRPIPLGAVGPGVEKLQNALGIEATGTYDQATEDAFVEHLKRTGREPLPTLKMLKFILNDYDEKKKIEEEARASAAPMPEQPGVDIPGAALGAMAAAAQAAQAPMQKEQSVDIRSYDPASYTGYTYPAGYTGGGGGVYGLAATSIGTHHGNLGIQPISRNVGPDSSEDDLKAAVIQSAAQGNELLNAYLRDNLGITDPFQLHSFKISPAVLWSMVSAFILGNDPRLSFSPISGRGVVTTQPTYTPPELFPSGSGYSLQKSGNKEDDTRKAQIIFDNLHGHIVNLLRKSGWVDFATPTAWTMDKNGMIIFEHVVVKMPNGQIGTVSSINSQTDEVNVQWTKENGEYVLKTVKAKTLQAVEDRGLVLHMRKQAEVDMKDKSGFGIKKGDIVKILEDDQIGEVVGFNTSENMVNVETINKDIELVSREVAPDQIEVVNSSGSGDEPVPAAEAAAEAATPAIREMNKASKPGVVARGGGSKKGKDPRASGQIRFIVRSFGKWAGGKHRVCVARLRAEHPEIANGREAALCAWLKDNWMGTTSWRNRGKTYKSKFGSMISVIEEFGEAPVDENGISELFKAMSTDLGVDYEEALIKMDTSDYDSYLDDLFGVPGEEEVPKTIVNKFIKLFKSDKSAKEKASEVEKIFEATHLTADQLEERLEMAYSAVSAGITDALSKSTEEDQVAAAKLVVEEFSQWVEDHISNKIPVEDINKKGEFVSVEWEDRDYIAVPLPEESLAKRGNLEKGWMPSGMTQTDLDDGDFAWLSDAYREGKASKTEGRKLPYKINGVVNLRGWKAAWAALAGARGGTDLTGGPKKSEVAQKLLNDKPDEVEVDESVKTELLGKSYGSMKNKKPNRLAARKNNLPMEVTGKMKKAYEPGGPEAEAMGDNPEAGAEMSAGESLIGKTINGPDGNKYIVIDQEGDTVTAAAGRKRVQFSVDEVEVLDAEGGEGGEAGEEGAAPEMEKEGSTEERLKSAIDTLTEILSGASAATAVGAAAGDTSVEKSGDDASTTTLNDVIYFVNDLADQLDELKSRSSAVDELNKKLDRVGDLVKSVSAEDRVAVLEAKIQELEAKLSGAAAEHEVEEVSKRLHALESRPGSSSQLRNETVLEKAGDRMFRGLF